MKVGHQFLLHEMLVEVPKKFGISSADSECLCKDGNFYLGSEESRHGAKC